ncbi:hypothetical protein AB7M47_001959 [Bradyrhizobium elkanii]|jgi:hypothetical protein|nr:hypothetical protein [Bradyrhizobium elkanii]MCS3563224.1 hypothetical protein [Bradyrhizobium elkanii]MCW2146941.1 hypothetical protein [Bradyrhizobium elkanii]MCW2353983.1 hypothetical protein [Bradyrhizobium elkanii]MCW2379771.1 hypothetical protein [Bradyrhizobium elkanii]
MGAHGCRFRHPEVHAQAGLEGCTARLVVVDPSRRPLRGLLRVTVMELIRAPPPPVVPAKAGTHNHQ